jgi:molybdate transport system substrate-binding protein
MSWRATLFVSLFVSFVLAPDVGFSAEIKILSANVFTGVLNSQFHDFERISGHKVAFDYDTAGNIRNRVQSGELGDVAIVTRPQIDELEKNGKIDRGSTVNIARSAVALVVRRGAAKPDVGTIDAFKRALLTANSVSYADPARGGATGVLVTDILQRLDLAAEVKPKTKFPPSGHFAVELVSNGEAEMALAQPMEALLEPGVEIVGLLPTELQNPPNFTFAVGQMAIAKEPDAARSLIQYLVGTAVQSTLKSKGMEPGIGQ